MKINLECGDVVKQGYVNVNGGPVAPDVVGGADFVVGNYKNLRPIFGDNKADNIVFNRPLNVIPPGEFVDVLKHWQSFLVDGGTLTMNFINIRAVGQGIKSGDLAIDNAHKLTLGEFYEYKSIMDIPIFRAVIEDLGFTAQLLSPRNYFVFVNLINAKD